MLKKETGQFIYVELAGFFMLIFSVAA